MMLVYYEPSNGDIRFTLTATGHGPVPAGDYIEVDVEDLDPVDFIVVDGYLELRAAPSAAQRGIAQDQIRQLRGQLRQRFITDLPGQSMVYLEKRNEAAAYLAHPDPTPAAFPMVYAEVGITAPTAYEVAQIWLGMSDVWRMASTAIEAATLRAAALVAEAETVDQLTAAMAQMHADLSWLTPATT